MINVKEQKVEENFNSINEIRKQKVNNDLYLTKKGKKV